MRGVEVVLGAKRVLIDVGVRLSPGEHVAVVGLSGAGKSSLVAVLAGWLSPSGGTIEVDGELLEGVALARLRRATAWSDSSTRLNDASLAANADFGAHPGAPPASERLQLVGLASACVRLGDEPIGPDGARLSGPETQRLRLARALGRPRARLVLLDEALGALPGEELRPLIASSSRRVAFGDARARHARCRQRSGLLASAGRGGRARRRGRRSDAPRRRPVQSVRRAAGQPRPAAERAAARRDPAPAPAPPDTTSDAPPRRVLRGVLGERSVATPFALALLAALVSSVTLVVAGDRLGVGVRAPGADNLEWLAGVTALLAGSAAASAAVAYLLGRAAVALGRTLRRRALAAAPFSSSATAGVGGRDRPCPRPRAARVDGARRRRADRLCVATGGRRRRGAHRHRTVVRRVPARRGNTWRARRGPGTRAPRPGSHDRARRGHRAPRRAAARAAHRDPAGGPSRGARGARRTAGRR